MQSTGSLADLATAHLQRLDAVLAALAGWAEAGEPPIKALLPLGDDRAPALLLKANRQGGHGVILSAAAIDELDGHAERLLPLLPSAEAGAGFARTLLPVPPLLPPLPVQAHWPDIGIAWRDMALVVPQAGDVLPALATVLAHMQPPEQARRITGWATTAMLPAVGGFDPWVSCQLLVLGPGRARPCDLPHKIVTLKPAAVPAVQALPPLSHAAWRALRTVAGDAVPDWQMAMAGERAPGLLVRLAAGLPHSRGGLLAALLLHDPRQAAVLLAGWLAADGAAGVDRALIDMVPAPAMVDGLDALLRPADGLQSMPLEWLAALAAALPGHPGARGPLASDLAARLAELQPAHPALPAIVAGRLGAPAAHDLERLATPDVLRALGSAHLALALKLTAGAIMRPAASPAALAASLAAVRLATAR